MDTRSTNQQQYLIKRATANYIIRLQQKSFAHNHLLAGERLAINPVFSLQMKSHKYKNINLQIAEAELDYDRVLII